MNRTMKTTAVLALTLFATAACTRRVQVESEPNEPRYLETTSAPAEIDVVGVYDYVAMFDSGEHTDGPMTIAHAGDVYTVQFVTEMGEVTTSNVRRVGNRLTMDTMTPGGAGTIQLEWQDANAVVGSVFIGETIALRATRRS